jgi:hypothetical protein
MPSGNDVVLILIGGGISLAEVGSLPEDEVALDLLPLGPSGGRIRAGRNASGGAGREGAGPLAFL